MNIEIKEKNKKKYSNQIYKPVKKGIPIYPHSNFNGIDKHVDRRNFKILDNNLIGEKDCSNDYLNPYFKFNHQNKNDYVNLNNNYYNNKKDPYNGVSLPKMTNNKKNIDNNTYHKMQYFGPGYSNLDVNVESVMRGMPTRTSKSYGYPNIGSHHFDYIIDDLQDPKHVVMERPISTRLDNKLSFKKIIYKIYNQDLIYFIINKLFIIKQIIYN